MEFQTVRAVIFYGLFCFDSFVEALHESVNIDAVSKRTLFDIFKMSSSAAEAAHARIHENLDSIRIFLDNFHDAHVFSNRHCITS